MTRTDTDTDTHTHTHTLHRTVLQTDPPDAPRTPFEQVSRDVLLDRVWSRPGLSVRDRRLVTLACVAAADSAGPIDEHVYAALRSGDLTVEQLCEVTLHLAVYLGWPKASHIEIVVRTQWHRLHAERGQQAPPFPTLGVEDLGPEDREERLRLGREEFESVNLIGPPPSDSPYFHAGIINFVFGHVWRRPALSRRDRRLVTVPCVGVSDTAGPIRSHVGSALGSGDLTWEEVQELVLHFSAYSGFAKGQALHDAAQAWRAEQQ